MFKAQLTYLLFYLLHCFGIRLQEATNSKCTLPFSLTFIYYYAKKHFSKNILLPVSCMTKLSEIVTLVWSLRLLASIHSSGVSFRTAHTGSGLVSSQCTHKIHRWFWCPTRSFHSRQLVCMRQWRLTNFNVSDLQSNFERWPYCSNIRADTHE